MIIDLRDFKNFQNSQVARTFNMSPLSCISAPSVFASSTSSPFLFNLFDPYKAFVAVARRLYASASRSHTVLADALRMVGEQSIAGNYRAISAEIGFRNFFVGWRRGGFDALCMRSIHLADFGLRLNLGVGWGCSGGICSFR